MKITSLAPIYIESEIELILNPNFINQSRQSSFHNISIEFLSSLSKRILEKTDRKLFPELVALAYWLRKSNILKIINDFKSRISEEVIIVPRGLAFHVAPSNVDSIFLYSWALSLLSGNINIVRVTQKLNVQLELLLGIIRELMNENIFVTIAERNIIVTYPRDNEINSFISSQADLRILWGGDETIKNIKTLNSKLNSKDISFADKISCTAINSAKYLQSEIGLKLNLAKHFYNDSYWFDQMACSSPRFIFFIGTPLQCENASKEFWKNLGSQLMQKGHADPSNLAMEKLIYLYEALITSEKIVIEEELNIEKPTVAKIELNEVPQYTETCGGGFFFESFINNLNDLTSIISGKNQTLTYYGFDKVELKQLILRINGLGIDRIVPIGQALNFNVIWDGYDLLSEMTKRINLL